MLMREQGYYGCAVGKGNELAKTEIENLDLKSMSLVEAAKEVTRMYDPPPICSLSRSYHIHVTRESLSRSVCRPLTIMSHATRYYAPRFLVSSLTVILLPVSLC